MCFFSLQDFLYNTHGVFWGHKTPLAKYKEKGARVSALLAGWLAGWWEMAYLDQLPDELLAVIASWLPDQDRRRLERTSKRLCGIMRGFRELRPHRLVIGMTARLDTLRTHLCGRPLEDITFCNMTGAANNPFLKFATCAKELEKCPHLHTLRLADFPLPGSDSILQLQSLKQLTALDVSFNQNVCLSAVFILAYFPSLRKLSVRGCEWMDSQTKLFIHREQEEDDAPLVPLQWIDLRDTGMDLDPNARYVFVYKLPRKDRAVLNVVVTDRTEEWFPYSDTDGERSILRECKVPTWITHIAKCQASHHGYIDEYYVKDWDAPERKTRPLRELNFWG